MFERIIEHTGYAMKNKSQQAHDDIEVATIFNDPDNRRFYRDQAERDPETMTLRYWRTECGYLKDRIDTWRLIALLELLIVMVFVAFSLFLLF